MSIISLFTGTYCNEESAIREILKKTRYKYRRGANIVSIASKSFDLPESKVWEAFSATTSVFNQFTHEKERAIAYLKLAVAETRTEEECVVHGFISHLLPSWIRHVLRICLIADMKYRVSLAHSSGISESEALKVLHKSDEDKIGWTKSIIEKDDPWDVSIYDMVLPTDKMAPGEIADLVVKSLERDILKASPESHKAVEDFILASKVETTVVKAGHYFVTAEAHAGAVTLTINKNVLMLKRLEEDLQSIASKIPGVKSIVTKVGKKFYQTDIVRRK